MDPTRKLIRTTPLPLVDPARSLAVLFSAKAACTFAVKWFFSCAGLLEAALAHDPWVHAYRNQVYYRSKSYRPERILDPAMRVVKFVRNPYSRAVSSYIHAIRSGYANEDIAGFLGRPVTRESQFSFREFIAFVEQDVELDACDPHHKRQVRELERAGLLRSVRVVRAEEAERVVPRLEVELGLVRSDYPRLSRSHHHTRRVDEHALHCDTSRWPKRSATFPKSRCFYDESLRRRVHCIYAADFREYDYDPLIIPD